ncbi:MAG TPA: MFS transporter [Ktedonobacterales bacterium]|nr:MFS transporter [Ktedonobacterales bacterium]
MMLNPLNEPTNAAIPDGAQLSQQDLSTHPSALRLGLRENLGQFVLLASVTFGIGLVIGAERVTLPLLAGHAFGVTSFLATLSFIVSFGAVKAALNLVAGGLNDRWGRKPVLILGWLAALPAPFLIIFAPNWAWVVAANVLLGFNQGFAWTTTVTSKVDLVGPRNRGFALGINEFSGYAGVTIGGLVGGALAGAYGLRVAPFIFILLVVAAATLTSALLVRETRPYAHLESRRDQQRRAQAAGVASAADTAFRTTPFMPATIQATSSSVPPRMTTIFALTSWGDRTLATASLAGLIEKFADTLVWGLFPLYFARAGLGAPAIGALVGVYTGSWAILQLYTGHLSDRLGRKWLIAVGFELVAVGVSLTLLGGSLAWWISGALLMGVGMALLYPTLLATVSDVARPHWRGTALGVYRLWRDSGYAFGALAIGLVADRFGLQIGFWLVIALMAGCGLVIPLVMYETQPQRRSVFLAWERDPRLE